VYRTRKHQPARAVFWISADSRQSFEQGYQDIAKLLGVSNFTNEGDDDKRDIKQRVKAKLSDESFGQWLLVVDNADDTDVLFGRAGAGSSTDQLINYLPLSSKGSILFTTRTRLAAIKLAGSNVIALGELDKVEAVEVLETRLLEVHRHQLQDQKIVDEFLDMLFFLALAVVQAAAYINMNDTSISDYIAHYRSSEKYAIELLSEEFEDQGRYQNRRNAIATTWFISFEQIQKHNAIAADYLSFMACTANNGA